MSSSTATAASLRAVTATLPRPARAAGIMLADLLDMHRSIRREFIGSLSVEDTTQLYAAAQLHLGSPWGVYEDDPVGFVEQVLGENLWSKPREILDSIPDNRFIAVPSCFSSSKSWSLSRAVLWKCLVHPVGTVKVVTLAPMWRQVSGIMWPEIRTAHSRAGLPGDVGAIQFKLRRADGSWFVAATGMVGNARNESTIQGIHAAEVLLLVDESGGIPHGVGRNLRALLTNAETSLVAIGNPAADNEGSWFEGFCLQKNVKVIPISAFDTPGFTGEVTDRCRTCPREVPAHRLSRHLVQPDFVQETIEEFGEDSPYVQAKIHARFPKGGSWRILPSTWVEASAASDEPDTDAEHVRLTDLGLASESDPWVVEREAWIRLGVDIAADGGDEFVVARIVGTLAHLRTITSGVANQSPVTLAGRVLEEIRAAEALRAKLGTAAPIQVKIDTIGVGWGVVGILKAWKSEEIHNAEIIGVNVSEADHRSPGKQEMTPRKQRDAMWIAMRRVVQPREGYDPELRIRADRKTVAQLCAPTFEFDSSGRVVVESKDSMRERIPGLGSPDRAEALLLGVYDPPRKPHKRARSKLIVN